MQEINQTKQFWDQSQHYKLRFDAKSTWKLEREKTRLCTLFYRGVNFSSHFVKTDLWFMIMICPVTDEFDLTLLTFIRKKWRKFIFKIQYTTSIGMLCVCLCLGRIILIIQVLKMSDIQWRLALSVGSSDCANCRSPSVSWSETFPQRTALNGKHTHVKNIKTVLEPRVGFHGQR